MRSTINDLESLAWPLDRLGEAIGTLAHQRGLIPQPLDLPVPPRQLRQGDREAIGRWIEAAADWLDVEAEPVEILYTQADQVARNASPAILRLSGDSESPPRPSFTKITSLSAHLPSIC